LNAIHFRDIFPYDFILEQFHQDNFLTPKSETHTALHTFQNITMSSLINKAKEKLSSNNSSGTTENTGTGSYEQSTPNYTSGTTESTTGSYEQAAPNYSGTAQEQPGQNTYGGTSTEQPTFSNFAGTESSTATAGTTKTGPVHKHEALNKADPRVHEQQPATSTTGATNAPVDATQAPPSVVKEHLGEPTIEHEFPHDSTHKRHSVSHQEQHLFR